MRDMLEFVWAAIKAIPFLVCFAISVGFLYVLAMCVARTLLGLLGLPQP